MAKFKVDRGGGEYVFPSLGIIASDGDVVDLPADTDVVGLVLVDEKKSSKSANEPAPADPAE